MTREIVPKAPSAIAVLFGRLSRPVTPRRAQPAGKVARAKIESSLLPKSETCYRVPACARTFTPAHSRSFGSGSRRNPIVQFRL